MLSAVACLGCSTIFHWFYAHSETVNNWLAKLDYAGIAFLIGGSNVPPLVYGFYCDEYAFSRNCYLVFIESMCIIAFIITLAPKFDKPEYRAWRAIVFVIVGVSGALPVFQYWYTFDPDYFPHLDTHLWALGGGLYIFGAFVYASRIPECWYPGKFDYIGLSHNWWHVLILIAALTHYFASLSIYHGRRTLPCPIRGQEFLTS